MPVRPEETTAPEETGRRALLLAVQAQGVSDADLHRSLDELRRLAGGLGIEIVDTIAQKRTKTTATRLFGQGKLDEIKARVARAPTPPADGEATPSADPDAPPPKPDLVLVDTELSPGQQRFLQNTLDVDVLDRTAIILRVFAARARTRVARAEIEIARLLYESPRLQDDVDLGTRTGGGGGRGERGHTNAELARQRIRHRIAGLRRDIDAARATEESARARRADVPVVALVGYTNAGKSSLMRALTGSDVFIEDQLFATLGTTVRALQPETDPRILACDTVGFIENLPHALIASFRSTLEEAREADLLLYVVDAADPHRERQLEVTREVVAELGEATTETKVVFNKVDRLDPAARAALAEAHPDAILVSAHDPGDVERLTAALVEHFRRDRPRAELRVPYARGHLLGEIHAAARVIAERYDEEGTILEVEADPATLARLTRRLEGR
ncbi:MAG: GTPase HflX [Myxococcales bacterium]|nr:GTPase HflX [Myxococcales bacterium]